MSYSNLVVISLNLKADTEVIAHMVEEWELRSSSTLVEAVQKRQNSWKVPTVQLQWIIKILLVLWLLALVVRL